MWVLGADQREAGAFFLVALEYKTTEQKKRARFYWMQYGGVAFAAV